jgi:K+-transporting ATPase ATPase C chain
MKSLKKATLLFGVLFIITGILYPLAVTLVSEALFPAQAQGNLIVGNNNKIIGSKLIG